MSKLYTTPLRVYLVLGFLALLGIYCGLHLPVSLFPNSNKPRVVVNIDYGGGTADEFLNTYGYNFEKQLRSLSDKNMEVEKLEANYGSGGVGYNLYFKWGANPREALKEVQLSVNSIAAQFPQEIRDSINVRSWAQGTGYLVISYYSDKRDLDELYKLVEPILTPLLSRVPDADNPGLWNPNNKEVAIQIDPEKMASLGLVPEDIYRSLRTSLYGNNGGDVTIGLEKTNVLMIPRVQNLESVAQTLVHTPSGKVVHLGDIAHIDLTPPENGNRSFKTSGAPSLILWAQPKPGGNIKRMAEDILDIAKQIQPTLPSDVHFKVLVDPAQFIQQAVTNVFREVLLAAALAVMVLFIFIGNLKNVITAAIEIPLSIMLAFILMRIAGINLNLISLGGLALSAGMNVDASVVVMENIFRNFEKVKGKLDFQTRLKLVIEAVNEVKFPVIASTIASLVVFVPLAFTSDLSHALLSDLALAVVFSHMFSAVVALILVPTVRLQLMTSEAQIHSHSPIEKYLKKLEEVYGKALKTFLEKSKARKILYIGLAATLVLLSLVVLPKLPREIIGLPDTDWIDIDVNTDGNTKTGQMTPLLEDAEHRLLSKFGDRILYTFTQVGTNWGEVSARLKNKEDMQELWKAFQKEFQDTPTVQFYIAPWNPSELPIPNPPHLRILTRGGELKERINIARQIREVVEEKKIYPRVWNTPRISRLNGIVMKPNYEHWALLEKSGVRMNPSDLADISRVATLGRRVGDLSVDSKKLPIYLRFPDGRVKSLEDLGSLPVGISGKLVPLKALAQLNMEEVDPAIYRLDQREVIVLEGKFDKGDEGKAPEALKQVHGLIDDWQAKHKDLGTVSVAFDDPNIDLNEALKQLGTAIGLSILLIFLTMVVQFGDVMNATLVLISVPLGFIGVLLSLFIFKSTLSLNSALGVILLNGIAVANSIILVDFLKKLVDQGLKPKVAAIQAAQKRLRPILMTSLTTALGMLPIALGFGEGGKILQPLGIAIIGGLGFSMCLTLFVVPALQVSYLEWRGVGKESHPFKTSERLREPFTEISENQFL